MITVVYLDACPVCPPGIPEASPSIGEPEQAPEGTVTAHQCAACGTAWSAVWRGAWVIGRLLAPVQAEGLKGAAREKAA